jgi:hypothetical protein
MGNSFTLFWGTEAKSILYPTLPFEFGIADKHEIPYEFQGAKLQRIIVTITDDIILNPLSKG